MRIGIEAQRIFRKKKHGMDMVALELIRALQKIDTPHQFVVFVKKDEDSACLTESENVKIVELPSVPYPVWEQIFSAIGGKKHKVDVLHCTSNTAPLFLSVPLLITLHDIIYLEGINLTQGTSYQKFGNIYRKWNVPRVVKKARQILTVSDFEKKRICDHFGFGSDRVITAYNAAGNHFKKVKDVAVLNQVKEKYKLPDSYIFFLGNTDPKKNVIGVLKALSILNKRGELPCKLLMLDINRDYLQQHAQAIGDPEILKQISFTGYVPNQELPAIYSSATLFLYPSIRESFGIPMLEAMHCELPVICSDTSCMPEIAGGAAELCNPNDPETIANAIVKVWKDVDLQKEMIAKGIERVRSFSWERNAKLTLEVYRNL